MSKSLSLKNANIKLIIFNTIIMTHLRFQLNEILRCNFDENHNILFRAKTSFSGKNIFVLHFTSEFFNSETIFLIDKRNLLNFNGCIMKGT